MATVNCKLEPSSPVQFADLLGRYRFLSIPILLSRCNTASVLCASRSEPVTFAQRFDTRSVTSPGLKQQPAIAGEI